MSTEVNTCDWCGDEFDYTALKNKQNEVFCSAACADAIEGCK